MDFRSLRQRLLSNEELFVDEDFPPSASSLFWHPSHPWAIAQNRRIQWKRPTALSSDARLFNSRSGPGQMRGVKQGNLGDCWLIAACNSLINHPALLHTIFPYIHDQEFDSAFYCGVFVVRFWRFGRWTDVIIDDLLPTVNGQLFFCRSIPHDEYWCCLIEKAAAKLTGCYESLCTGTLGEALMDVSGMLTESIYLKKKQVTESEMERLIVDGLAQKALLAAAIETRDGHMEEMLDCGLARGHSYAVVAVRTGDTGDCQMLLIDPWASKRPDNYIGHSDRQRDGCFWLSLREFRDYFTDLCVCHRVPPRVCRWLPSRLSDVILSSKWQCLRSRRHNRAGGCSNFRSHFANPQFLLTVGEGKEAALMSLIQTDKRHKKKATPDLYKTIGIHIVQVARFSPSPIPIALG